MSRYEQQASLDAKLRTIENMTVMAELFPDRIQYHIEGGGQYTQEQAEELATVTLNIISRARSLYRKMYGKAAP